MNEGFGRSALILGFGREGRSVLKYLNAKHPEVSIGIADKKFFDANDLGACRLHRGKSYLDSLSEYDTIIRSPGISPRLQPIADAAATGKTFTSLTKIFFAQCPGRIIAVTGTKGKSTTSSLIAALLQTTYPDVRMCGNIGVPALDYLAAATAETIFVLECSSFQLEDLAQGPDTAVLLNIVPEHLDYHGSFDAYRDAKANITRFQSSDAKLICSPEHPALSAIIAASSARKIFFGTERAPELRAYVSDGRIFAGAEQELITLGDLPVKGPGNVQNVLAAVTAALTWDVSPQKIREGIDAFNPLPHRLEAIGTFRGIQFYNDSLATIPEATANALQALGPVHTLVCGGHDRGLSYENLAEALCSSEVRQLILFPVTGEKILAACRAFDPGFDNRCAAAEVADMRAAVEIAYRTTPPQTICLLSPAASSLNLFRDYQDRGEQFKKCVTELGAGSP